MARQKHEIDSCSFTARDFDRDELERWMEVLAAMGAEVECRFSESGKSAAIEVSNMPSPADAETARTRNAGRPSFGTRPPCDSIFDSDTLVADFLGWLDSGHTAGEAMGQLGLSRSTYFRRLKRMRELAEWEREHNPGRAARGMREIRHTLGGVN